MQRRSGLTLVEVLVAMFIMSIGMIALLTLFPIGVLRMAQSIRDARCEQMARNAYATAVMENVGMDIDVIRGDPLFGTAAVDNTGSQIPDLFVNPSPKTSTGGVYLPNADNYSESYPILVDPIGFYQGSPEWVGGPGFDGVLRRRPVEFLRRGGVTGALRIANTYRAFSLWDEIRFISDPTKGLPGTPQGVAGAIFRDPRFTSAYVLRRPQTGDKSLVECTVVVYENRSVAALEEYVYSASFLNSGKSYFNPTNNTISIDYTPSPGPVVLPELRPGDWIMDATTYLNAPPALAGTGSARAFFYRIVGIEEVGIAPSKVRKFEVQSPLRGLPPGVPPTALGWPGTAIVMVGVAEVFEKGLMRLP